MSNNIKIRELTFELEGLEKQNKQLKVELEDSLRKLENKDEEIESIKEDYEASIDDLNYEIKEYRDILYQINRLSG